MKKLIICISLFLMASIIFGAHAEQSQTSQDVLIDSRNRQNLAPYMDDKSITIATGLRAGIYEPAGNLMCRIINRNKQHNKLSCETRLSNGSLENLSLLDQNKVDIAIVQSDWQESAYEGLQQFTGKRMENLRFLFSLYHESFAIVVREDSGIRNIDGLKNKSVNVGPENSGIYATWQEVMIAKNWNKSFFKRLTNYKSKELPTALCNKQVDALVFASGHPNPVIAETANICGIKILEINDNAIKELIKANPEFMEAIIPGGLYPGVKDNVLSFGVKATVVTNTNLSSELVYKFTKTIFENYEVIKNYQEAFAKMTPDDMVSQGRTAPYHPGAYKYFQEKGYLK